ncbi:MAG TPA: hypothetical protein VE860_13000, partial [Chthoniobacterales bacterium]|nr:hypothetical protein [Chthoniobacterales bacterium]
NLYARSKELVGDRDPRQHEFSVQLRAFDSAKNGAGVGVGVLLALCSSLLQKSIKGGFVITGGLNLGGSIETIFNPVAVVEIAIEKGAASILMPIAAKCQIDFDPVDVPRRAFMTAGEGWLACRDGKLDPNHFGHGDVTGTWFIKINVIRDHHVLNGHETSAWDGWRAALSDPAIGEHEVALLNDLAARPEQQLVEVAPDWLG